MPKLRRRCHARGFSLLWVMMSLIPILGLFAYLSTANLQERLVLRGLDRNMAEATLEEQQFAVARMQFAHLYLGPQAMPDAPIKETAAIAVEAFDITGLVKAQAANGLFSPREENLFQLASVFGIETPQSLQTSTTVKSARSEALALHQAGFNLAAAEILRPFVSLKSSTAKPSKAYAPPELKRRLSTESFSNGTRVGDISLRVERPQVLQN